MTLQGLLSSVLFRTHGSFISCGLMNAPSLCTVSGLGEMLVGSQLLTVQFPNFSFSTSIYVWSHLPALTTVNRLKKKILEEINYKCYEKPRIG